LEKVFKGFTQKETDKPKQLATLVQVYVEVTAMQAKDTPADELAKLRRKTRA
jgi:hypothetical protein